VNGFLWASGHLGWPLFALIVLTGLCWLAMDLVWRLTSIGVRRLAATAFVVWIVGMAVILLGFWVRQLSP